MRSLGIKDTISRLCRSFVVRTALTVLALAEGIGAQGTSIEVLSPEGGECLAVGSTLAVRWAMHDNAQPDGGVAVLFSPDEGKSWIYLSKEAIANDDAAVYRDSVGTFTWTIVDSVRMYGTVYVRMVSSQCIVRVEAPYDDTHAPALSNPFTISPATPVNASRRTAGMSASTGTGIERASCPLSAIAIDGRRIPARGPGANRRRYSRPADAYLLGGTCFRKK